MEVLVGVGAHMKGLLLKGRGEAVASGNETVEPSPGPARWHPWFEQVPSWSSRSTRSSVEVVGRCRAYSAGCCVLRRWLGELGGDGGSWNALPLLLPPMTARLW